MRSLNRNDCRRLAYLITLLGFCSAQNAAAQIVYSVGTQEVYDSNIFLEDDKTPATIPVAK